MPPPRPPSLPRLRRYLHPSHLRRTIQTRASEIKLFTRTFLLTLLYLGASYAYITHNYIALHNIHGRSMAPLLSPTHHETGRRDLVLFRRDLPLSDAYAPDPSDPERRERREVLVARGALRRGMVVALDAPHDPRKIAIKRVVALEGDEVTPLVRDWEVRKGSGKPRERVVVPLGHVWVEGEDKEQSRDSNDYGPVSKSLIIGVGTWVVLPLWRWGRIDWEKGGLDKWAGGRVKVRREEVFGIPEEWAMD